MKRILALLLAVCMILALAACGTQEPTKPSDETPNNSDESKAPVESKDNEPEENLTAVQKIIKEAEGMTLEELAK